MFGLIIDTSTEQGCVIFSNGRERIFQGDLPYGLNSSKYLLKEIERGLKILNKNLDGLKFIAVGIGPGSYTGIRMGVITAKTIAFSLKKDLVAFCSLEAFVSSQNEPFAALIDAKIGGAYILKENQKKPKLISLDCLGEELKDVNILVSPNMKMIKPKLENMYPLANWKWEEKGPDAQHLTNLVYQKFSNGDFSDPKQLELLYLRKTQAEIERESS